MTFRNFPDTDKALQAVTHSLEHLLNCHAATPFNIALSGGETAKKMFALWASSTTDCLPWKRIHFYWVDERCVPPTDDESNYGHARRLLFEPLHIDEEQIHRIHGEADPTAESERYAHDMVQHLPQRNGLPHFDCIILGVGADAHTASIFPTTMNLLTQQTPCAVSTHPTTHQKRITLTGPVILNATPLLVPILGTGKEIMLKKLREGYSSSNATPAAYILSQAAEADIFTTL